MPTTLYPRDAEYPGDIRGFIRDGEVFHIGDRVMLTHRPSKSRLFGTLGPVYGVGRIRGFQVKDVPFGISTGYYPMGKPGDEIYGLSLVERGDAALAAAKAHYERQSAADETASAWASLSEAVQEGYLSTLAMDGKL